MLEYCDKIKHMTLSADDFREEPKEFCESIQLAFTPEYFALALSSGIAASFYAITPQHAKRLSQYLAHQVSEYEKEHGIIVTEWSPNIVSPVQRLNRPSGKS
jgi:hypothetical protein